MKTMIHTVRRVLSNPSYWLAFAVVALCTYLQLAGYSDALRFDRQSIGSGNWMLLLSGNFVHLGNSHLFMNMAGFALIVALVWSHFTFFEWLLVTLFSSLVVGAALYWRDPDVALYVGFSGTLHGLIIAGCLADLKHYPKSAALLLTLIIGKLAWEQIGGALPGSEAVAGGTVIVNSHLYGAIGGALIGAAILAVHQLRQLPENSN